MKHILAILSYVLFLSLFQSVNAQVECMVLVPQIDSAYFGKCKNGFAHGKGTAIGVDTYIGKFFKGWPDGAGTYTWANGDTYTGDFKEGKRHGEGKLTLKLADRDSIVDGLWEEDIYLGAKPKKPRVIYKSSVDRYSFKKTPGTHERVLINFLQSGTRNTTIEELRINSSSGAETRLGNSIGYDYVEFPVRIKLSYTTLNKLKSMRFHCIFEFEISEPGDWVLDLHN